MVVVLQQVTFIFRIVILLFKILRSYFKDHSCTKTQIQALFIPKSGLLYMVGVQGMSLTHGFVGSPLVWSICAYTITYKSPRQAHPEGATTAIIATSGQKKKKALHKLARRYSYYHNPRTS